MFIKIYSVIKKKKLFLILPRFNDLHAKFQDTTNILFLNYFFIDLISEIEAKDLLPKGRKKKKNFQQFSILKKFLK